MSKSKKVATPVADRGWAVFGEAAYAAPIVDASGVTVNQGRLGSDRSKVVKKEDRVSKPARKSKKVAEVIDNGAGVVEAFEVALDEVVKQTRVKKEKVKKEVPLKKFSVKVTMEQAIVVEVQASSRKQAKMMVKQREDIKVDSSKSITRKFRVLRDNK